MNNLLKNIYTEDYTDICKNKLKNPRALGRKNLTSAQRHYAGHPKENDHNNIQPMQGQTLTCILLTERESTRGTLVCQFDTATTSANVYTTMDQE